MAYFPSNGCLRAQDIEIGSAQETAKEELLAAESAAQNFLGGCAASDWDIVQKFWSSPLNNRSKQVLGGLAVVSIGKAKYAALTRSIIHVPCETRFKRDGKSKTRVLNLKKSKTTGVWRVEGGI